MTCGCWESWKRFRPDGKGPDGSRSQGSYLLPPTFHRPGRIVWKVEFHHDLPLPKVLNWLCVAYGQSPSLGCVFPTGVTTHPGVSTLVLRDGGWGTNTVHLSFTRHRYAYGIGTDIWHICRIQISWPKTVRKVMSQKAPGGGGHHEKKRRLGNPLNQGFLPPVLFSSPTPEPLPPYQHRNLCYWKYQIRFCCKGLPCSQRMLTSIPGLYPQKSGAHQYPCPKLWQPKMPLDIAPPPLGAKVALSENLWTRWGCSYRCSLSNN